MVSRKDIYYSQSFSTTKNKIQISTKKFWDLGFLLLKIYYSDEFRE